MIVSVCAALHLRRLSRSITPNGNWVIYGCAATLRQARKEAQVADVVYTSQVTIERIKGPLRKARLPGEAHPVVFSVHGAIAEHYQVDPSSLGEPHAATIDYVVAAAAG